MGLFRKTMSVGTLGLIGYRTDIEKARRLQQQTRRAQRQTRNAARAQVVVGVWQAGRQAKQTRVIKKQTRVIQTQAAQQARVPAGWYPVPTEPGVVCWWDGYGWHLHTRHFPAIAEQPHP